MRYIAYIAIPLFFLSCSRGPEYDKTPTIKFEKIRKESYVDTITTAQNDSIIITIYFQDGDGDLGTSDTSDPDNYIVQTLKSTNGVFNPLGTPIDLGGKFSELAPENYTGPIDGLLDYSTIMLETAAISNPDLEKGDTLKFRVYIIDQAGNTSNTIETDPITILE